MIPLQPPRRLVDVDGQTVRVPGDATILDACAAAGKDIPTLCYDTLTPKNACRDCVEVCPTGALSFKSEFDMRAAGTWEESRQTRTTTIRSYCGVGCNLTLHVQDNKIVKVTSPHDNPVTHDNLCVKGRFGYGYV